MHVLCGGRLRLRKRVYFPDADRAETIDVPVSCFLIRHKQGNVLFDTGCHPSVVTDAEARWGGLTRIMTSLSSPQENVIAELSAIGVAPQDIDIVVNSHFHPDHCGCNEFFRQATILCHAEELAAVKQADAAAKGYVAADWDHPIPLKTIEAEHDLFGDGRVVLIPLPGHTPGCIGALVGLDRSGPFLLASDAVSIRANLDRDIVPRNTWDAARLTRTFAEIRRIEAGGATVICGHDQAQWVTLRKTADAYD
jgi:glyoxylase-like metal-dependent hydrolase (beta-lactamase superfamily II)